MTPVAHFGPIALIYPHSEGKVKGTVFIGICLFTFRGMYPIQLTGGYPILGQDRGDTSISGQDGGVPHTSQVLVQDRSGPRSGQGGYPDYPHPGQVPG